MRTQVILLVVCVIGFAAAQQASLNAPADDVLLRQANATRTLFQANQTAFFANNIFVEAQDTANLANSLTNQALALSQVATSVTGDNQTLIKDNIALAVKARDSAIQANNTAAAALILATQANDQAAAANTTAPNADDVINATRFVADINVNVSRAIAQLANATVDISRAIIALDLESTTEVRDANTDALHASKLAEGALALAVSRDNNVERDAEEAEASETDFDLFLEAGETVADDDISNGVSVLDQPSAWVVRASDAVARAAGSVAAATRTVANQYTAASSRLLRRI